MPTPDQLTEILLRQVGGGESLRLVVARIATAALRVADGDAERVERWFTEERIRAFGGRLPSEIIAQGDGERLLDYVDSLGAGAAG
jgi:hypothetical protein